jgi:hypothetical protein
MTLLFILALLLVMLAVLLPRMRRYLAAKERERSKPEAAGIGTVVRPQMARATRPPSSTPSRRSIPVGRAALRTPRYPIGNLREARHAIVLMTIFGPCRGLDPPP